MASNLDKPLIVIVGPTASGKTSLAIELALRYDGEIICADSRTVFREMNIGTAKPTTAEMQGVAHWGLDLVNPGERYTAAAWQAYARSKIEDINARGKLPIVVGGTGLYVDGLIFDYQYPDEPCPEQHQKLESMTLTELISYCEKNNILLPANFKNKRHLIRSILDNGYVKKRGYSIDDDTIVVGITTEAEQLRQRIVHRIEHMLSCGLVNEAKRLGETYGWHSEAMTGNVYPLVHEYILGSLTLDELKQKCCQRDSQLAKRQMTWFRRNPYIVWGDLPACEQHLSDTLVYRYKL